MAALSELPSSEPKTTIVTSDDTKVLWKHYRHQIPVDGHPRMFLFRYCFLKDDMDSIKYGLETKMEKQQEHAIVFVSFDTKAKTTTYCIRSGGGGCNASGYKTSMIWLLDRIQEVTKSDSRITAIGGTTDFAVIMHSGLHKTLEMFPSWHVF